MKTREEDTQCRGSVSGVESPEPITFPQKESTYLNRAEVSGSLMEIAKIVVDVGAISQRLGYTVVRKMCPKCEGLGENACGTRI